ncbi:MAG: hypothetical protein OEY44_01060, partial [Candidatus Peregrinibacteria bacterium]|nr:hypothetical protein [Candidatus Peregrinibacteria bacterium]
NGDSFEFQYRLRHDPENFYCWDGSAKTVASGDCDGLNFGEGFIYSMSDTDFIFPSYADAEAGENVGASFFYQHKSAGGGRSPAPEAICSSTPVTINLPSQLPVTLSGGEPEVEISWSAINGGDINADAKVAALLSYLETDPEVGDSGIGMANLFAGAIYDELSEGSDALNKAMNTAIGRTIQSNTGVLDGRGISTLFDDYWPYMFTQELRNDPALAEVFMSGVEAGLKNPLDISDLLSSVANSLRDIEGTSHAADTHACMIGALSGVSLTDFVPNQGDSLYGSYEGPMATLIEDIKAEGKVKALLTAIRNDAALISATESALDSGINSLLLTWKSNSNVRELINLFETDEKIRDLWFFFSKTPIAQDMADCVKTEYKTDLLALAKEVYVSMVKPILDEGPVCSDGGSAVMQEVVAELMNQASAADETGEIILNFINDYLATESTVDNAMGSGTPFADYYNDQLDLIPFEFVDGMSIEIYRNDQLLHTVTDPDVTEYVDSKLPANDTSRIKYYEYQMVTKTACATAEGSIGKAQIDPVLTPGTPVDVFANLKVRMRSSYNEAFMDRLHVLLESLLAGDTQLGGDGDGDSTSDNTEATSNETVACLRAAETLRQTRNSDNALSYVLACFGDEALNDKIREHQSEIVTPLLRLIMLGGTENLTIIAQEFMSPIIAELREELENENVILPYTRGLLPVANELLEVENLEDLTNEQMQWIICGSTNSCDSDAKSAVARYFAGASHQTDIIIEIYDESGALVRARRTQTNLFGEAGGVSLGLLDSGKNHTIKVKPGERPYTLPKIFHVLINNAQPDGQGGFFTTIDLVSQLPFRFGNFDNSDDVIDLNDVVAWNELVKTDPAQWSNINVDGFAGLDLFDAVTIQSNWGAKTDAQDEGSEIVSLSDLLKLFGYSGGNASRVSDPGWLNVLEENSCLVQ